ncbi:MAG: phosphatase PAP2 family protein [Bacteroidetes bacterium HGW-Bacteroidetes-12]|nr:MAG: phosphatase PAP2 family protein [Bacteroidetes bacterium HGW-Bacteroidetes-12]
MQQLIDIDVQLFLFLNGIHSPFFDVVFSYITSKTFWYPFYLLLFIVGASKLKWKMIYILIAVIILIVLSDQASVQLFKEVFQRLRPCHNPQIAELVHLVDGCGGKYGFISSHATNTFALALFMGLVLNKHIPFIFIGLLCWAIVVSYSRVYVGVHYVSDIFVGALLGMLIGWLVFFGLKKLNQKFKLQINI